MSAAVFAGFPERALDFYEGLEADNTKAYWTDHRPVYDACVLAPLRALVEELGPEFGEAKVFRPYRDVRFSGDKTPYKTHAAAVVEDRDGSGRAALYVQLSAAGLVVGCGYWHMAADQVQRWRAVAAADGPEVAALASTLDGLVADGWEVAGDTLKTVPRGVPRDHPRAALLRHRGVAVLRRWPPEPWLHERACLDVVADGWRAAAPVGDWLQRHVGASRLPADQRRR